MHSKNHPDTIIVVHPKEKRSKCSVEPFRGQVGFIFWKFPHRGDLEPENYVRLAIDAPLLSSADAERGLLILDGTWRLAGKMEEQYEDVSQRGLANWQTAYPRKSKLYEDPVEGLATVEALFAAYAQMGRSTEGILDEYHWAEQFLELNSELITRYSCA